MDSQIVNSELLMAVVVVVVVVVVSVDFVE